jgi:hypothetical protein
MGIVINLIATATNPFVPSPPQRLFSELYWPAFVKGAITPDNVFHMMGLDLGRWCILAWGALFAIAVVFLGRMAEASEREAATIPP